MWFPELATISSHLYLPLKFFLCLMLVPTVLGQSANESPVRVMRLNTPVEGDLAAGGTQTFAFHVESRQLAVFVLEQKGFDAVLAIDEADDGKRLIEANVNFGFFGYNGRCC